MTHLFCPIQISIKHMSEIFDKILLFDCLIVYFKANGIVAPFLSSVENYKIWLTDIKW